MTQSLTYPTDAQAPPRDGDHEGVPLYLQVTSTMRTAIQRGIYPVGSRIPTEYALCERFNVSRHTIREALRHLRADGLITSRPGSRPIVATPPLPKEGDRGAGEISEDIFDYVISTRLRVDVMEMVEITPALASETGLPADEQWLLVTGYRSSVDNGETRCWDEYYFSPQYATAGRVLARHVGPILPLLEDLFNERIVRLSRIITATEMPADHAAQFRLPAGSPAIHIVTHCEKADGGVAFLHRSIHANGALRYTIDR